MYKFHVPILQVLLKAVDTSSWIVSRHKPSDGFKSFFKALMEFELNQKYSIFTQEGYKISHALLDGFGDFQRMVRNEEVQKRFSN